MALYQLTLSREDFAARNLTNDVDFINIAAASEGAAKAYAAAKYGPIWLEATAASHNGTSTENWKGWSLEIQIEGFPGVVVAEAGAEATLAALGAAAAVELNKLDGIAAAAFAVNTLTVAAAGDALGDKKFKVALRNPQGQNMSVLLSNHVDGGVAGDALKIDLPAGAPAQFVTEANLGFK